MYFIDVVYTRPNVHVHMSHVMCPSALVVFPGTRRFHAFNGVGESNALMSLMTDSPRIEHVCRYHMQETPWDFVEGDILFEPGTRAIFLFTTDAEGPVMREWIVDHIDDLVRRLQDASLLF
jgi:hypothetical protein